MRRRFRQIPVRTLLPNLITLLALCAGLTAIRLAIEGQLEWAVAAIVFAARARRRRRSRGAHAQGHVAVRRRTRQPRGLRQFRRGAGAHPLLLGPAGAGQCRLDRRHGVCDLRRAAARALQRHDRRSQPAGLDRQLLHRHAGAGRRDRGAAADLSVFPVRRRADRAAGLRLHAGDRVPDGVADTGVLGQAGRQTGGARNGAAGVRLCRAVLRAAGRLSVVGAHHRHADLSRRACRSAGCLTGPTSASGRPRTPRRRHATAIATGSTDKPAAPQGPTEPPADPERPARLN